MKLRVLCTGDVPSGAALIRTLEGGASFEGASLFQSLEELFEGLRESAWNDPVVVFIRDDGELDRLEAAAEVLWRHRLVLILPDDEPGRLARGHILRPRVLFSQPVETETVAAVAARMLAAVAGHRPAADATVNGRSEAG